MVRSVEYQANCVEFRRALQLSSAIDFVLFFVIERYGCRVFKQVVDFYHPLTTNPELKNWLGLGHAVSSPTGVAGLGFKV